MLRNKTYQHRTPIQTPTQRGCPSSTPMRSTLGTIWERRGGTAMTQSSPAQQCDRTYTSDWRRAFSDRCPLRGLKLHRWWVWWRIVLLSLWCKLLKEIVQERWIALNRFVLTCISTLVTSNVGDDVERQRLSRFFWDAVNEQSLSPAWSQKPVRRSQCQYHQNNNDKTADKSDYFKGSGDSNCLNCRGWSHGRWGWLSSAG